MSAGCPVCAERLPSDDAPCPREAFHDTRCELCGTLIYDDRCECLEYCDCEGI